jgi:hypothetical protein
MSTSTMISEDLLAPRMAALGYVKLGELGEKRKAQGTGREYQLPRKLDHFRVTTRERGPDNNFLRDDAVHALVGDRPMELDFRLPFDDVADNFRARMTEYEGRTCKIACDGERYENNLTGLSGPCHRRVGNDCKCKPNARLTLILEAGDTFGGVHLLNTTSWESAANIQTTLKMFHEQFGSLRGLPLRLKLYPAEVTYQEGGQTKVSSAWKVGVVLRATFEEAATAALQYHRTAQLARHEIRQLASGMAQELARVEAEDSDVTVQEFFPEAASKEPPRIGRLNQLLAGEVEAAPEDGPEEAETDIYAEVARLLGEATAAGVLTPRQIESTQAIIAGREEDRARTAVDWLGGVLAEATEEAR